METPVSRSALYGKLAGPLFRSLESATAFCKLRSNPWVELTHWLHQLTQQPDNDILHVLRHYQIPLSDVEKALLRQLDMLPAGCIDSLEVRKKPGGHWIIRDLMGLDLVGLASL